MNIRQKLRRKFGIVQAVCYGFVKIGTIGIIPGALFSLYVRLNLGQDYEHLISTYIFSVASGFLLFGIVGAGLAAEDWSSRLDDEEKRKKRSQEREQETELIVKNMTYPEIANFVEKHLEKLGSGYEGFRIYSDKLVQIDSLGDQDATNEFITKVKPLLDPYYQANTVSHHRLEKTLKSRRPTAQ